MFNLRKDIEVALEKYPELLLVEDNSTLRVQGTFVAHNGELEIDRYEIEIRFYSTYPFSFPWVRETGNRILPRDGTRHINTNDDSLCLANPFDEALTCRAGISLLWFLDAIVNPHLCREYVREKKGKYITGERSHGVEGLWESFYEIYETKNKHEIVTEINNALYGVKPDRNTFCHCGSNIKYKKCHGRKNSSIFSIDRKKMEVIFHKLKNSI